jgi:cellulose synthase operon protein C
VSALDRGATARLSRLAADTDASVRASAFWSLGVVGDKAELPLLERGFDDRDVGAAANAVAAYARIGQRERLDVGPVLCRVTAARRAAVRENALAGLRVMGVRCASADERRLLSDDTSPAVRRAAAQLVRDVNPTDEDRRALRRCGAEEPDGAVALSCTARAQRLSQGSARSLVFVVPVGEALPTPRAPFALIRPDGLTRHGTADRRGAVYELELPAGELSLGVPALFGE